MTLQNGPRGNALVIGGAALCSAGACCRFFGGCGLAPACWRFKFRAANSGIPGRPQPGNECRRSLLRLWRIATVQSGSKLASYRTPNSPGN